jgi:hypothetical protein
LNYIKDVFLCLFIPTWTKSGLFTSNIEPYIFFLKSILCFGLSNSVWSLRRVAETSQFVQMRKIMQTQSGTIRDLRRRLEKYEPDSVKEDNDR